MNFYTYMWLRKDGTPYYVGKCTGPRRAFESKKHNVHCPTDSERIILQEWLCETDAFEAEKFFIAYYGRKDISTGILRNMSDGGEGPSGVIRSAETRQKMSLAKLGKKQSAEVIESRVVKRRGIPLSAEHRKHVAAGLRGRKRPPHVGLAVAASNRSRAGKPRHGLSSVMKAKWQDPVYRALMAARPHRGRTNLCRI